MQDSEDTIYSTMFSSLKHPVRRKILRMLSDKTTSFSQMLEELGVSSSHLTYHLESLGELVSKTDAGDYKLSTFGEAAVSTMRIVEDAPVVQSKQQWHVSLRWKAILAALIIGIVLLASFSAIQFNAFNNLSNAYADLQTEYDQLSSTNSGWNNTSKFLRDVIELDLSKYETTLLSNAVDHPSELGGLPQQIQHYQLVSNNSRLDVTVVFKNNILSKYQLSVTEGSPIYARPQPFTVVDSAKWLLNKTITSYEDTPYLGEMYSTVLALSTDTSSVQLTQGNSKFNMSVLGAITEIQWYYSENGVDFVQKGVRLIYENQVLKELDDGYFLYNIENAQVNVDQAGAIQAARNAIKDYPLSSGSQQVVNYKVLDQPVSVVFDPQARDKPLALVPHWTVTLYLDTTNLQTNINRLAVGIWADTGKVEGVAALSG
jgi:hypothetical protein